MNRQLFNVATEHELEEANRHRITTEGMLNKKHMRRRMTRQWAQKYFVMRGGLLQRFKDAASAIAPDTLPEKVMRLCDLRSVELQQKNQLLLQGAPDASTSTPPEAVLQATSPEEASRWHDALRDAIPEDDLSVTGDAEADREAIRNLTPPPLMPASGAASDNDNDSGALPPGAPPDTTIGDFTSFNGPSRPAIAPHFVPMQRAQAPRGDVVWEQQMRVYASAPTGGAGTADGSVWGCAGNQPVWLNEGDELVLGRCRSGAAGAADAEMNNTDTGLVAAAGGSPKGALPITRAIRDRKLSKKQAMVSISKGGGHGLPTVTVTAGGVNPVAIQRASLTAGGGDVVMLNKDERTTLQHGDVLELDGFRRELGEGDEAGDGPRFGLMLYVDNDLGTSAVAQTEESADFHLSPPPAAANANQPSEQRTLEHQLGEAVRNTDADAVRRLLDEGVSADGYIDASDHWPLLIATKQQDHDMMKLLLDHGATADTARATKNYARCMHYAAANGHVKGMRLLVDKGAAADARMGDNSQPVHWAARRGKLAALRFLVNERNVKHAALDRNGRTPQVLAQEAQALDCVQFLRGVETASTANFNEDDPQNGSSNSAELFGAVRDNEPGRVKRLLEGGCNPNSYRDSRKLTALHAAVHKKSQKPEMLTLLLQHNANPEVQNHSGNFPLHWAVNQGAPEMVRALLQAGANIECTNHEGFRPLHFGASVGNLDGVRLLLEHGGGADAAALTTSGVAPLHLAASAGKVDVMRLLRERAPEVVELRVESDSGRRPIHFAAHAGRLGAVRYLVEEAGAVHDAVDANGHTAMALCEEAQHSVSDQQSTARRNEFQQVIEFLRSPDRAMEVRRRAISELKGEGFTHDEIVAAMDNSRGNPSKATVRDEIDRQRAEAARIREEKEKREAEEREAAAKRQEIVSQLVDQYPQEDIELAIEQVGRLDAEAVRKELETRKADNERRERDEQRRRHFVAQLVRSGFDPDAIEGAIEAVGSLDADAVRDHMDIARKRAAKRQEQIQAESVPPADLVGRRIEVEGHGCGTVLGPFKRGKFLCLGPSYHQVQFDKDVRRVHSILLRRHGNGGLVFRLLDRPPTSGAHASGSTPGLSFSPGFEETAVSVVTSVSERVIEYTPAELENATGNFAESNKLDEGAFGIVYRGFMNGLPVAVKMLKVRPGKKKGPQKFSAENQFRMEAEVLGKFRHQNIVALLGHCFGNDVSRPCLVYEYMAGASLKARLRPPDLESSGAPQALSWRQRLSVAADIASGLTFLHEQAGIVHQDIKTANILLAASGAGSFVDGGAKIADFGTVRAIDKVQDMSKSHITTRNIVGTGPYMAPEYVQSGQVSEKTDAFAFGVVLLELLTGKPAACARTRQLLVDEVGAEIEDPERLLGPLLDRNAGEWKFDSAVGLANVARRCIETRAHNRMSAASALPELNALARRGDGMARSSSHGSLRSLSSPSWS